MFAHVVIATRMRVDLLTREKSVELCLDHVLLAVPYGLGGDGIAILGCYDCQPGYCLPREAALLISTSFIRVMNKYSAAATGDVRTSVNQWQALADHYPPSFFL